MPIRMDHNVTPEGGSVNAKTRVALVEDDEDLLQSTQEYLAHAGYRVWGEGSAEAFFRRFVGDPVDVVVLDIGLPGEDGLSVASLLEHNPNIAVIILSARDALEDRISGLRAGADLYLVKPVNLAELVANIDAVVKRLRASAPLPVQDLAPPNPATINHHWVLQLRGWQLTAPDGQCLKLTGREFALLHRLMEVQGQTVAKKDLANEIIGPRIGNASDRINVLITRLRKKAADQLGQPLPIQTAHQIGYAFTAAARLS